jgi:dephospho-CoA kinase
VFNDRVAERLWPTVAGRLREDVGLVAEAVGWIGGGRGSGKTTVARALAARHGLRIFPVDAFWYGHSARLNAAQRLAGQLDEPELTPDQQWLGQTPEEQAEARVLP